MNAKKQNIKEVQRFGELPSRREENYKCFQTSSSSMSDPLLNLPTLSFSPRVSRCGVAPPGGLSSAACYGEEPGGGGGAGDDITTPVCRERSAARCSVIAPSLSLSLSPSLPPPVGAKQNTQVEPASQCESDAGRGFSRVADGGGGGRGLSHTHTHTHTQTLGAEWQPRGLGEGEGAGGWLGRGEGSNCKCQK